MWKKLVRALLGVFALTVLGVGGLELAWAQTVPSGEQTRALLARGQYAVGKEHVVLVDSSRATRATKTRQGGFKGAPERTLDAVIWYPAEPRALEALVPGPAPVARAERPFPLVVYSHGFMSFREESTYLSEYLASQGYIVFAANYPLTNYFAPGGPFLHDVIEQPKDVSFILDTLLGWHQDKDSRYFQRIDETRIAAVGVSLGGMTSTLAVYHPTLKDARIDAAVSLAGPAGIFTERFYQHAQVPFMMVGAGADAIVPYASNAATLPARNPGSILVTLKDASHTSFADIASTVFRWMHNPDSAGCAAMMGNVPEKLEFLESVGEDVGIKPFDKVDQPCVEKSLPRAMRPVRHHDLTRLATWLFLESHFASEETKRKERAHFLLSTLATENPDVTVVGPASVSP